MLVIAADDDDEEEYEEELLGLSAPVAPTIIAEEEDVDVDVVSCTDKQCKNKGSASS